MPAFKADAALAAYAQRAAQVMRRQGMAGTQAGGVAQIPVPQQGQQTVIPKSLLGNRVNQLGGLARMSASMTNALKLGSMYQPQLLQGHGFGDQSGLDEQNSMDTWSQNDFERGFAGPSGMSGEEIAAAAFRYAQGRSYGGV